MKCITEWEHILFPQSLIWAMLQAVTYFVFAETVKQKILFLQNYYHRSFWRMFSCSCVILSCPEHTAHSQSSLLMAVLRMFICKNTSDRI